MKKCPFCAEEIQDEAVKCRFCGEFFDREAAQVHSSEDPIAIDPRKLAEIRKLQRIASGRPTRTDTARKAKGILYLVIIIAILIYSWHWKRTYENQPPSAPAELAISFEAFNAIFGPASPLSLAIKQQEFEAYKGKTVVWTGQAVYINRGEGAEPYFSVRHRVGTGTADVWVRINKKQRAVLESLSVGQTVRYRGKIVDFGAITSFIELRNGAILPTL